MKVLVWDLPTRLFHWIAALAFTVAWFSAESDVWRHVHVAAGYVFFGLLLFRVIWGFAGSRYARFASFLFSPRVTWNYLRAMVQRRPGRYIGHNPAGAWAIFAMLILGVAISVTGILVLGGEEQHGIASGILGFPEGGTLKELHEFLAQAMLLLVAVHVAGVVAESILHKEDLTGAMVSGTKPGAPDEAIASPHYGMSAVLVGVVASFVTWSTVGYFLEARDAPYLPFVGRPLADDKVWRDECGTCHLAFHPTLLPARSWARIMQTPDDHFGSSMEMDPATLSHIRVFLQANAADGGLTEPAFKINQSIPREETPVRITETPYWRRKHAGIRAATWQGPPVRSRANCGACHRDAERGTFEDGAMRLP